jgi:hypothetical protein
VADVSIAVTVPGEFVGVLRKGIRSEVGSAAEHLGLLMHDVGVIPDAPFRVAKRDLDAAHAVLDHIGLRDSKEPEDVEFGLSDEPLLVLQTLQKQHTVELLRLQDAEADGIQLSADGVHRLGEFVEQLTLQVMNFIGPVL